MFHHRKISLLISCFWSGCILFGAPTLANETADDKQQIGKAQKQIQLFETDLTKSDWINRQFLSPMTCPISTPSLSYQQTTPSTPKIMTEEYILQSSSEFQLFVDGEASGNRQQTRATGLITLRNRFSQLGAGEITLNNEDKTFSAIDKILIETKDALFSAESALGKTEQRNISLLNTQFKMKEIAVSNNSTMNGSAKEISINSNGLLTLNNLQFTTCPTTQKSWYFEADQLKVDSESGWGEADDLVIYLADIPIFYLPWLMFPIDDRRHTGLLPPTLRHNQRNGLDFTQPIYWNIAPNYDMTFSPRHIEKRGFQLGTEFRYLTDNSQGNAFVEYLDETAASSEKGYRWSYQLDHTTQWSDSLQSNIDADGVSDSQYYYDLGSDLNSSNREFLTRRVDTQFFNEYLSAQLLWETHQNLNLPQEPYHKKPQLNVRWDLLRSSHDWTWDFFVQHTQFESKDTTAFTANRAVLRSNLSHRMEDSWYFLEPSLHLFNSQYSHQRNSMASSNETDVSLVGYSLDSGLVFEKITKTQQITLEPRIYAAYIPYEDQTNTPRFDGYQPNISYRQLFQANRFSGYDRVGDTQKLSVGLTNRWLDAQTQKEQFSLSIGQSLYFDDRVVTLTGSALPDTSKRSPIVTELTWHPANTIELGSTFHFNTQRKETESSRFHMIWEPKEKFIVNLSHRFRDVNGVFREQGDLSFSMPIGEKWQFMGRWNEDLIEKRSIEHFLGVEYESCCWSVRLLSRRYLNARLDENGFIIDGQNDQYNRDIFFQFIFKGIGGNSQKRLNRILDESIQGLQPPNY